MDIESILEGLTQEERLALLERLVKSMAGAETPEEELTIEERVKRLEDIVLGWWGRGPRWGRQWGHRHGPAWAGGGFWCCPCC